MKQQDAYKLIAAFMILIMIIVPVAYVITSPRSDTESQTSAQQSQQDKYNPEFWTVDQPFYSIADALNITPYGAVTADFVDINGMTPQMKQAVLQYSGDMGSLINDLDNRIYKSNTTKMYFATLPSIQQGVPNFLLLSTMYPDRNNFEYIVIPNTNNILKRQDTGAINIMGNPVIYAPQEETASQVLEIMYGLNKTNTSLDLYNGLLNKVEPAQYQTISSNVTFAKQFYIGVRAINGSYERTTAYMDVNSSTLEKINGLKTNSTKNGFELYNLTTSGNYTYVRIVSTDISRVFNEEIY
ncbi:MAG: hypothetical protein O8C63_06985 [Candidatus Methanoperedens sp.]|nr:hypothetical protein [Candidatus Methanoperedens sp.]